MMNAINEAISKIGVVPVIKLNHPQRDAAPLAKALCAGGVPVAEVTFRAEGADTAIHLMKEVCPDMIVGAGTVTNTDQIDRVLAVGGQFIVTPGFDAELVAYAQEKGLPIYPGCTTPTGGVSLKNLAEYIKSPIIAACGGSYMVTADLIDNQKWDEITDLCRQSRAIVEEACGNG